MSNQLSILVWAGLWYFFSGCTLFLNKYILSGLKVDPNALAAYQMCITCVLGGMKVFANRRRANKDKEHSSPMNSPGGLRDIESLAVSADKGALTFDSTFWRDMTCVGCMRCLTVVLGLVAVKFVAVSFVETVKASAPFFTVAFAYLMLGERTSLMLAVTLLPVVGGLVLCSATELSFNIVGFMAAITCNTVDCVQNVFSKKLLSSKKYTPVELQFYTSASALAVQLMIWTGMWAHSLGSKHPDYMDPNTSPETASAGIHWSWALFLCFAWDGIAYHLQSVSVYTLMSLVSPVTVSVANTFKRALLILVSVFVFKNNVSGGAAVGTCITFTGVLWYNDTKTKESKAAVA